MAWFRFVVAWVSCLGVTVLAVILVLAAGVFFFIVFFSPTVFYDSEPSPVGTPPSFATATPSLTPFPTPGVTGTVSPPTNTPPVTTPFPSPGVTGTVLPPLTKEPPPPTVPPTPRHVQERKITTRYSETIMVGEQTVIRVNVTKPDFQVATPTFGRVYVSVVNAESGNVFEIYFVHPDPTLLTLIVSAENFRKDYNPDQAQEIFVETRDVEWTVSLAPLPDISGQQDITITLTQSLPSGDRIPPDIKTVYTEDIVIHVEPVEEPKDEDPPIIRVLKWALPDGPVPVLVWIVSVLTLVVTFLGGRRIRKAGSADKSSQEHES